MHSGYIYSLVDPRVGEPRYVGWTVDPPDRLRRHIKDARSGARCYRNAWIRKLLRENVEPQMIFLEENPTDYAEAEKSWIRKYREAGYRLTNQTDGGDGAPGYHHTPETLALLREMFTGKPLSEAHRCAISAGQKGRVKSLGERKNISAALKGKTKSPEHIAKIAASKRGKKQSPEHAAKSREVGRKALIELNQSSEHRARTRTRLKGKKLDPSIGAKISAARLGKKYPALSAARAGVPVGPSKQVECPDCGKLVFARGMGSHRSLHLPKLQEKYREATYRLFANPEYRARHAQGIKSALANPEVQERRKQAAKVAAKTRKDQGWSASSRTRAKMSAKARDKPIFSCSYCSRIIRGRPNLIQHEDKHTRQGDKLSSSKLGSRDDHRSSCE